MPGRPPLTRPARRRAIVGATITTATISLTACGQAPVHLTVPAPGAAAAEACRALTADLPDVLDGASRRAVEPESDLIAAWGDPPIVLRCGVARPASYEPTSLLGTYDGVDWLPVEADDGYVFYATGRVAWIEVAVPSAYAPEPNPLIDLAEAINVNVPVLDV